MKMKLIEKENENIPEEYEELLKSLRYENSKLDLGFMLDVSSESARKNLEGRSDKKSRWSSIAPRLYNDVSNKKRKLMSTEELELQSIKEAG